MLYNYQKLVSKFNALICGIPAPFEPRPLTGARKEWAVTALREEITELEESGAMEDQADALIDLIYFAFGRLYEMGVPFGHAFDDVHNANMSKTQGSLSKRPGSLGFDAVKGPDFQPPLHKNLHQWRWWHVEAAEAHLHVPMAMREAAALLAKKTQDYNGGSVKRSDYFPFGHQSYQHMLWTKVLRLRSLTESGNTPNHESLRDSALDLINYASFYADYLEEQANASAIQPTAEKLP